VVVLAGIVVGTLATIVDQRSGQDMPLINLLSNA
jgi:hypothetical protein